MKTLPKSAQIYIIFVLLLAVALLLKFTVEVHFDRRILEGLLYFSILAVFTDSLKVNMSRGGYVTVTSAVTYACLLLFGAAISVYVTLVGIIGSKFVTKDKSPWYKLMFNCGQFIICISVAQFLYLCNGGITGRVDPTNIIPLAASTSGYFIVNGLAITSILALVQGVSLWGMWVTNLKWSLPNMFTLSLLGILMAGIYNYAGYWGVSLFFGPLLLARFIFKSYMEARQVYLDTLEALASALDAKDTYTRGHSERVAKYAVEIARELKLPEDQIETLENTALLHDIGKIGVDGELLNRIGKLTRSEYDVIKLHPAIGANILKEIHDLGIAIDYVRHHHEKYDGSGYPDRLQGESIPLGARIITLADSFDAMTSGRSYREKMNIQEALEEVRRSTGTHFDPRLAETFIRCWQGKKAGVERQYLLEAASTTDK